MINQARRKLFSIGRVFSKSIVREAMLGGPRACSPGEFKKNQAYCLHSNEF